MITMTYEQLIKHLNENPDHEIYVDTDSDGQLVIYTGLQIGEQGFEPIDDNTKIETYRIDDAFGVVYKWNPEANGYVYHCRKENFSE